MHYSAENEIFTLQDVECHTMQNVSVLLKILCFLDILNIIIIYYIVVYIYIYILFKIYILYLIYISLDSRMKFNLDIFYIKHTQILYVNN